MREKRGDIIQPRKIPIISFVNTIITTLFYEIMDIFRTNTVKCSKK